MAATDANWVEAEDCQAGNVVPIPRFPLAWTTMCWLLAVVKLIELVAGLTVTLLVPEVMRSLVSPTTLARNDRL
jgi:hypothetical protein